MTAVLRHRSRRQRFDEAGLAGGEAVPLGILVFVIGTLLAANAWAVVDARAATGSAAREATRAYVEAEEATQAAALAEQAAASAIATHGRDPSRLELAITHPDGRPWGRCVPVQVTAIYRVAMVQMPWSGAFGDGLVVRATHGGIIDPWRSGLPGQGCP